MEQKRSLALGFFDGAHMGHKALFDMAKKRAAESGSAPSVISFDAEPIRLITGRKIPLINLPNERAEIIRRVYGIEDAIFLHFDRDMMNMEWDKFVEWLVFGFGAVNLIIGYDFKCGRGGKGDAARIAEKCGELGVALDVIPEVTLDGLRISSTYIRELLAEGNIWRANQFLGHPHTFTDEVRYGYRFGRTLGLPTINMRFSDEVVRLPNGVYATKSRTPDGKRYMSVTNIGVRPTVGGGDRSVSVETHLLGYSGNLYGQRVCVEFYKYLRPERRFTSPEELRIQIESDIDEVKRLFEYIGEYES